MAGDVCIRFVIYESRLRSAVRIGFVGTLFQARFAGSISTSEKANDALAGIGKGSQRIIVGVAVRHHQSEVDMKVTFTVSYQGGIC